MRERREGVEERAEACACKWVNNQLRVRRDGGAGCRNELDDDDAP